MSGRAIALTDDEWDIVVDELVAAAGTCRRTGWGGAADILTRVADKIEHQHDRQRQMFADPALDGPQAAV